MHALIPQVASCSGCTHADYACVAQGCKLAAMTRAELSATKCGRHVAVTPNCRNPAKLGSHCGLTDFGFSSRQVFSQPSNRPSDSGECTARTHDTTTATTVSRQTARTCDSTDRDDKGKLSPEEASRQWERNIEISGRDDRRAKCCWKRPGHLFDVAGEAQAFSGPGVWDVC